MIFFIKNPNLTKKILAVGRAGAGGVARVSEFLFFFQKNPSLFSFWGGEGKGGLASVSEFVLHRIQI